MDQEWLYNLVCDSERKVWVMPLRLSKKGEWEK
jgi:hypothetical protein